MPSARYANRYHIPVCYAILGSQAGREEKTSSNRSGSHDQKAALKAGDETKEKNMPKHGFALAHRRAYPSRTRRDSKDKNTNVSTFSKFQPNQTKAGPPLSSSTSFGSDLPAAAAAATALLLLLRLRKKLLTILLLLLAGTPNPSL
jgi:hypothetical protein